MCWNLGPLARSNNIPVLNGFVNTIDWDQNQSDLSDLDSGHAQSDGKSMNRGLRCWTWLEGGGGGAAMLNQHTTCIIQPTLIHYYLILSFLNNFPNRIWSSSLMILNTNVSNSVQQAGSISWSSSHPHGSSFFGCKNPKQTKTTSTAPKWTTCLTTLPPQAREVVVAVGSPLP